MQNKKTDSFKTMGDFLHSRRVSQEYSQAKAAVYADVSLVTYRQIESNHPTDHQVSTLQKMLAMSGAKDICITATLPDGTEVRVEQPFPPMGRDDED